MNKYTYPKKKFDKSKIDFMYVFFDNGDYVSLNGSEVIDLEISLYDRLIRNERGVCPVAESGFIKLKIEKRNKAIYNNVFLYNAKEYKKDRIAYIQNRCVNEGGIRRIQIFDENSWHDTIYGNIACELDGEFLILKFLSQQNFGSSSNENNEVMLHPIGKSIIESIDLDFENCDGFTIYDDEIIDVQLEFDSELYWGSDDLLRNVKSGYIKCKLDSEIDYRKINLYGDGKITLKKLEQRLCGQKGQAMHDICHLYIDYKYYGFCAKRMECVVIEDIRPDEELERLAKLEEEGKYDYTCDFIGGACKREEDGTLIITFGKNAENLLKKLV